jgi:hypothetical protein
VVVVTTENKIKSVLKYIVGLGLSLSDDCSDIRSFGPNSCCTCYSFMFDTG